MRNERVTEQRPFDRPIFAFGMPRSGTTWLGKILDSHPLTLYRHEPDTWHRLDDVPLFAAPEPGAEIRLELRGFIASLPDMLADRVCGKRPLFPKAYASSASVQIYALRSFAHKALGRLKLASAEPHPPQPRPGAPYRLALKSILGFWLFYALTVVARAFLGTDPWTTLYNKMPTIGVGIDARPAAPSAADASDGSLNPRGAAASGWRCRSACRPWPGPACRTG